DRERVLAALAGAPPGPGRFEPVDAGQPFDVVVDFAHSPDAVRHVLGTARELVAGRGGRGIAGMGRVARSHRPDSEGIGRELRAGSDRLILSAMSRGTAPRMVGLEGLMAGARAVDGGEVEVVLDRRAAIGQALAVARPGDLVAILGRGADSRVALDGRG